MKKNFKKIISILLIALSFSCINVKAQTNMKIERKTYITTGTRKEAKFYTNKGYAYCITPNRTGSDQGTTLTYMSRETKGGVLYLLENAGTSDNDYLATQLAIWTLRNNYMPDYYVQNPNLEVVKRAKTLAKKAASQSNYTSSGPTLRFQAKSTNLTLNSAGTYYESDTIVVGPYLGRNKIKVELVNAPEGSSIQNAIQSTLESTVNDNCNRIMIRVPASKVTKQTKFQLKATNTAKANIVERYTTGNSNLQDLVVLVSEDKSVTKTIDFTITPVVRKCEYYNNHYYDKNGNITTKETYSIQCESHTCEKVGDKYFGKSGKIVTEEAYKIECFSHTCEKVGDKYFGTSGQVITEEAYQIECFTHICEKVGDKYFGKNGEQVIETDYKAQCEPQQVYVPDTESKPLSNIIYIMIGSILLGTVIGTINYYHDRKKIMN